MSARPSKLRVKEVKGGSKRLSLCSPIYLFGFGLLTFIAGNVIIFYVLKAHVAEDSILHFANFKSQRAMERGGSAKKGLRDSPREKVDDDMDDDDDRNSKSSLVSSGKLGKSMPIMPPALKRAHDSSNLIIINSSDHQHDQVDGNELSATSEGYLVWRSPSTGATKVYTIPPDNGGNGELNLQAGTLVVGKMEGNEEVKVVHPFEKTIILPLELQREHVSVPVHHSSMCSTSFTESKFLIGIDFPGGDLPHRDAMRANDAQACCVHCEKVQACTLWTFISDTQECWLKHDPAREQLERQEEMRHTEKEGGVVHDSPPNIRNKSASKPMEPRENPRCTSGRFKRIGAGKESTDSKNSFSRRLSDDPFTLKRSNPDIDWLSQWPIGTGKMGALVGGDAQHEIMPISISDFYVTRREHQAKFDEKDLGKRVDYFHAAREALKRGDFTASHGNLSKLMDGGLGTFEYVADIVLKYAQVPLISTEPSMTTKRKLNTAPVKGKAQQRKPLPKPRPKPPQPASRYALISHIDELHEEQKEVKGYDHEKNVGTLGDSTMDLRNGIASSVFLEKGTKDTGHAQITTREYFASSVDQVMVTDVRCKVTGSSKSDGMGYGGCLNVALQMVRQNSDLALPIVVESNMYKSSKDQERDYLDISFSSDLSIQGNTNGVQAPNTHVCAVYTCSAWKKRSDISSFGFERVQKNSAEDSSLICNSADRLQMIVSIASRMDHLTERTEDISPKNMQDISAQVKETCWKQLQKALNTGVAELRKRHKTDFAAKMSAIQLNISPSTMLKTKSPPLPYTFERPTIPQLYQHARYLMLSSGRHSVVNLQGIWTDGPTSPWNGDYHLNINIEQAYWAVGAVGFRENYGPLIRFVERLASGKGHKAYSSTEKDHVIFQDTANSLYGCKGWVAHGFMDPLSMNSGIMGDTQWALCVTCGAWLALTLWEALLYEKLDKDAHYFTTVIAILKIYRGIVVFFSEYMFEDTTTGTFHTGPTTSPENSYLLREKNPRNTTRRLLTASKHSSPSTRNTETKSKPKPKPPPKPAPKLNAQVLTFSPAIDMSVLKQVANIYGMLINLVHSSVDSSLYENFNEDVELSRRFTSMVQSMPGGGNPVVSDFSGLVMEYPNPLPGIATPLVSKDVLLDEMDVSKVVHEDMNFGHRHFSSLHWIYPATFSSFNDGTMLGGIDSDLYTAAVNTIDKKIENGGGHTSWSATWAACLYARLRQGSKAQDMIDRVIDRYTTSNLWSLHPPLKDINSPGTKGCTTCVEETVSTSVSLSNFARSGRGLLTSDDSKVQLDGSWGFLAAINEMLVQSHNPGVLELLPAISADMSEGELLGFVTRGDINMDLKWANGIVQQVNLEISGPHFWNTGNVAKKDGKDGYFEFLLNREGSSDKSLSDTKLLIVSPNALELSESPPCVLISPSGVSHEFIETSTKKFHQVIITSYPCRFLLKGH